MFKLFPGFRNRLLETHRVSGHASGYADMDAAACKADSHDVVLLFFSGHGVQFRGDVHLLDSNGEFVSSRTLRHRFESKVKERGLVDVTLLLFLDCCQERKGT